MRAVAACTCIIAVAHGCDDPLPRYQHTAHENFEGFTFMDSRSFLWV